MANSVAKSSVLLKCGFEGAARKVKDDSKKLKYLLQKKIYVRMYVLERKRETKIECEKG